MELSKELKQGLFEKFSTAKSAKDTGSSESQVAIFTERINHLTGHQKTHPKDNSSQKGLLNLVSKRKKILQHLHDTKIDRYRKIIAELEIRK